MAVHRLPLLTFLAAGTLSVPALADDCANAMLTTAQRPVSTLITKIDAHGKKTLSRTVQTPTLLYVQTEDGEWHSVAISIKDKLATANEELKTAKLTCRKDGSDTVNGAATTVYALHVDNEGIVSDSRIWVAATALVLRADNTVDGAHVSAVFDFTHVTAPANAKPIGER